MSNFDNDLNELGIFLNKKQKEQFTTYYEILIQWNSYCNLTSITDYEEVYKKHFIDSLALVKIKKEIFTSFETVIDVGTGAGFPGIPLKIAFPELDLVLLDSLKKRVKFLDHVIDVLGLNSITTIHGRAEDFARGDMREKYDLCVSRAVANLSTLSEYCLPFVKPGGFFISYKSEKINEETANAQSAITILGGEIVDKLRYNLPNSDISRTLMLIMKNNKSPSSYPRKAGLPEKKPL